MQSFVQITIFCANARNQLDDFLSDTVSNEWYTIPANGYSTILSEVNDKGVVAATVVFDQSKLSDITGFQNDLSQRKYNNFVDINIID